MSTTDPASAPFIALSFTNISFFKFYISYDMSVYNDMA